VPVSPILRICECCGAEQYFDLLPFPLITSIGKPGVCGPCSRAAVLGNQSGEVLKRGEVLSVLRDFAEITGIIPKEKSFRKSLQVLDLNAVDRGTAVALLMKLPTTPGLLEASGCNDWSQVLAAAGIGESPAPGSTEDVDPYLAMLRDFGYSSDDRGV